MGILFADNMMSYGSSADVIKRYGSVVDASLNYYDPVGGPDGDPCLLLPANCDVTNNYGIRPASNQLGIRFKFRQATTTLGSFFWHYGMNSIGNTGVNWALKTRSDGKLEYTILGSTVVAAVSSSIISDGVWHLIELFLDARDSGGTMNLWVDNVLEGSVTGDTFSGTAHATQPWISVFELMGASVARRVKDLIIFDSSGGAGELRTQEQPIGPLKMKTFRPNGAGSIAQFNSNGGANYLAVDEQGQDGATSYVQSATSGHRDLYTMENMTETPLQIYGVQQGTYWQNPGGGVIAGKQVLKSGAATSVSDAINASLLGDFVTKIHNVNPDGSVVWTEAAVNAIESGFEVA